jgi:hypothetical protein
VLVTRRLEAHHKVIMAAQVKMLLTVRVLAVVVEQAQ